MCSGEIQASWDGIDLPEILEVDITYSHATKYVVLQGRFVGNEVFIIVIFFDFRKYLFSHALHFYVF